MLVRIAILSLLFAAAAPADDIESIIDSAMAGLDVVASGVPYSRTIQQVLIGRDAQGNPKTGVVYREIESFKTITGVVIVDKTQNGYVVREAIFPDINKIQNAKDRKQVKSVLKQFKGVSFDPYAEKSAVDALSGATRYGIKTSGYLNYMARHVALTMDNRPEWARK